MPDGLPPDPGIIDLFLRAFDSVFALGWTGLTPNAMWLLSFLSVWVLVPYLLLAMVGIQSMLPAMVLGIVKIFSVVWLVSNLQWLTNKFADWVILIGLFVGRQTSWLFGAEPITLAKFLSPGTVLFEGFNMMLPVIRYVDDLSWWDIAAILMYDFFYVIPLWICFGALALSILVAIIEFKIVALCSVFPVAFAVYQGTAFVAAGAVGGIIASGARLATLALVTGIILPLTFKLAIPLDGSEPDLWSLMAGGIGAVFMGFMAVFAPRYASTVFGGAPAFTGATLLGLISGLAGGAVRGAQRWARA